MLSTRGAACSCHCCSFEPNPGPKGPPVSLISWNGTLSPIARSLLCPWCCAGVHGASVEMRVRPGAALAGRAESQHLPVPLGEPVLSSARAAPACRRGWGSRMLTWAQGSAHRCCGPSWRLIAHRAPGAGLALASCLASSLGSNWRLSGQALVSGKRNATTAEEKARRCPARTWPRKEGAPGEPRAGPFPNPPLQIHTAC